MSKRPITREEFVTPGSWLDTAAEERRADDRRHTVGLIAGACLAALVLLVAFGIALGGAL